jgi:hypothetical protein
MFARRMFRWAAIYGVIVLAPLYLIPLPPVMGETLLGFIGLALVFQGLFWMIGSDPQKYRRARAGAVWSGLSGASADRVVCHDRSGAGAGVLSRLAQNARLTAPCRALHPRACTHTRKGPAQIPCNLSS